MLSHLEWSQKEKDITVASLWHSVGADAQLGFRDTKGGACSAAEEQNIRSSGISSQLLRKHNSPGAFAHFRVPRDAGAFLPADRTSGHGVLHILPSSLGRQAAHPQNTEPSPVLLPLLCCHQLLQLLVNPKHLSCSACHLHLKWASSDKEVREQTAFLGSKTFITNAF